MKQVTGQFDNNDENDPFDRYVNESSKQDFKLLQIDVQGSRKNLALENVLDDMSYLDHTQQSLYETSNSHYSVFNNPLNDEVKQNLMMKKKQYVRKFGTPEESERTITQKGSTRHQAVPETVRQGFESVESHNRLGTNEKHSEGYLTLETERKEIYEHSTDFLIESCGYKKIVVMDKPQNLNRSPPEAITDCLEERSPGSSHGDKNRGTAKFGDKIGDSLDRHRGEYFVGAESPSDRQRGPRNLDSEAKGLGSDQMGGYSSRGYMGLDGGENNENYNSSNGQNTPLTRKGLGGYQQGKKLHRDQIMTEPLGFQNNHKKGVVGYKNDENGVDKGSRMLKKITSLEDSGKDSMIEASPYERYMVHMYDSNNLYGGDDGSLEQINLTNFINEPSRGGLGNSVINPAILNQKDSALYMAKLNDRTVDATISDLGKSNAFEFFGSGNEENYVGPMNQKVVLDDTEVLETGRKTQRSGSDAAPEANQVVSQNVSDLKRPPEAGVGRERLARGELVEERRPLWPINDPYGAQVRQKPRTTEMSKKPNQTEIYNGFESSRALQHHEQENKIYINRMQKKPEKVVQMLQKSDPRSQNHQEIEMGGGHLTPIPDPKEETMRLRSSTNRQSNRQGTTTMGVIEPPTQHSTANKAAANHQVVSSFNPSTPIQPQKLPGNLSRRSQRAEHAQASPHHSQKQLQENLFKKKRKRSESSQEIYSRRVIQTTTTTPHQEYLMQTEPVTRTNFRSRNSSSRTRADPRLSNRNLMINQNIESTAYKLNPMQTITTSHNNSTHKMVTPQRGGSLLSATANLNNRAFSKAKIAVGGYEGVSDRQLGAQGGPSISVTPLNQKQPSTIEMKTIGTVSSNMVTEQTRKSEGIAKKMPQALSHRHMSHIKQIKGTINQPVSEIPQRAVYYRIKGLNGENLVFDNVEDLRNEMTRQNKIIEQHRRGMDVSPLTPSVSLNNTQNKANNHPSVSRPKSPNMSITPTRKILLAGAVTPQTRVIPSPTQMNSLMPSSISSKTCNSERHLKSQREVMKLQQHIQSYQFKGDKKVKAQVVEEVAGAQQSTQSQLSGKNVLENGIGSFKVKASQQSTDGLMGHFGDDFDENEVGEVNLDNFGDYMSKIAGGSHAVNSNLRANSWKCFYLRMKRPLNYLGIIKVSNKILNFLELYLQGAKELAKTKEQRKKHTRRLNDPNNSKNSKPMLIEKEIQSKCSRISKNAKKLGSLIPEVILKRLITPEEVDGETVHFLTQLKQSQASSIKELLILQRIIQLFKQKVKLNFLLQKSVSEYMESQGSRNMTSTSRGHSSRYQQSLDGSDKPEFLKEFSLRPIFHQHHLSSKTITVSYGVFTRALENGVKALEDRFYPRLSADSNLEVDLGGEADFETRDKGQYYGRIEDLDDNTKLYIAAIVKFKVKLKPGHLAKRFKVHELLDVIKEKRIKLNELGSFFNYLMMETTQSFESEMSA